MLGTNVKTIIDTQRWAKSVALYLERVFLVAGLIYPCNLTITHLSKTSLVMILLLCKISYHIDQNKKTVWHLFQN